MSKHEGYFGTVNIQDVQDMLADLTPGEYSRTRLYNLYSDAAEANGRFRGSTHAFGRLLGKFGHERVKPSSWRIVDTSASTPDGGGQMPSGHVG